MCGYKYYLLIVDDFSNYTRFFPLKAKSALYSTFVVFENYVETSLGNKIKCLRSDSGVNLWNLLVHCLPLFLNQMAYLINSVVHIHLSKMVVLRESTDIWLKQQEHYWLFPMFQTCTGLKLSPLQPILSIYYLFLDWLLLLGSTFSRLSHFIQSSKYLLAVVFHGSNHMFHRS